MHAPIAAEAAAPHREDDDSHAFHAHGRAHRHDDHKAERQTMPADKLASKPASMFWRTQPNRSSVERPVNTSCKPPTASGTPYARPRLSSREHPR